MGFRYVVFGAGRQGTAAAYDLLLNCQADSVLVVDPSSQALHAAVERLRGLIDGLDRRATFVESTHEHPITGYDAALSCAPFRFNAELTEMAIRARVPFCDLGGNPDMVARQQELAGSAACRTPVVPDCGVSPGLSNILAVHLARHHQADRIHVRCGGLPETEDAAPNPLKYKLLFSPYGLISEYSGRVPIIRNGQRESIEALSRIEPFGDGTLECAPTSNNSPPVVEFLLSLGVKEYDYMTIRYPGHWAIIREWKAKGCFRNDPKADAELAGRLATDPALRYNPHTDRDRLILSVQGSRPQSSSTRGLREHAGYSFDLLACRQTRFSAMELTTSWGGTMVAYYMARHCETAAIPRGFATPERFIDTAWAIAELNRRLAAVQ